MCHSDFDCEDEFEKDDESLQEAYEEMYTQWQKVCTSNRALNGEFRVLWDLSTKIEGKIFELEVLLTEKDENLKSVTTELERTQKTITLLNNGTSKLERTQVLSFLICFF